MLPMQTCWDSTVPFSGQSMECVVCCLMGTNMTQPKITNTSVVRLESQVSASIVIAENAQVHRDQQAFFSNEKNKTNFISLLTTHLRGSLTSS